MSIAWSMQGKKRHTYNKLVRNPEGKKQISLKILCMYEKMLDALKEQTINGELGCFGSKQA
jgi:hypothetical protein